MPLGSLLKAFPDPQKRQKYQQHNIVFYIKTSIYRHWRPIMLNDKFQKRLYKAPIEILLNEVGGCPGTGPRLEDMQRQGVRSNCPMSIHCFRALVEGAHQLELPSIWPRAPVAIPGGAFQPGSAIPDAVVDHHSEKGPNCHSQEHQCQFADLVQWFCRPACEVVAEGAKRMMLCGFNMDNTTHDPHIVDVFKSIPAQVWAQHDVDEVW